MATRMYELRIINASINCINFGLLRINSHFNGQIFQWHSISVVILQVQEQINHSECEQLKLCIQVPSLLGTLESK